MTDAKVDATIQAPIEKVWEILQNFGDLSWGNINDTRLEGEGVGCVRIFTATGGLEIRERLERLDSRSHILAYSILESPQLPWTDYLAHIELRPCAQGTRIDWSAHFEPRGLPAEAAQGIVRAIFENGITNLKRSTEG